MTREIIGNVNRIYLIKRRNCKWEIQKGGIGAKL